MTRRTGLGIIFVAIGLVTACIGIFSAVGELGGLYTNALDHPLDDPKGGDEHEVSRKMLWAVGTGTLGAAAFFVGMRMAWPRRKRNPARWGRDVPASRPSGKGDMPR